MKGKVYQLIASAFVARQNCERDLNSPATTEETAKLRQEWFDRHGEKIEELVKNHLPSGSGFDAGTKFDFDRSREDLLVFTTAFHHMNDGGYYDGWSENIVVKVRPTFQGIDLTITGIRRKNRDDADYFYDTIHYALTQEVEE